jgi:murein DD-endopeptidase MepM/ murein hydrolase activator NlpD
MMRMKLRRNTSAIATTLLVAAVLVSPRSGVSLAGGSAAAAELTPSAPGAAATRGAKCPSEPVVVNLLSADDSTIEPTAGSWTGSNAELNQDTERFYAGTASLSLTASDAGDMSAETGGEAVTGGRPYSGQARVGRAAGSRHVSAALSWRDSAGAVLSVSSGAELEQQGAEDESGWTWVTASGKAPTGAASVSLRVSVEGVEAGETHYVDVAMVEQSAAPSAWVIGTDGVAPQPKECDDDPNGNGDDDPNGNGNGGPNGDDDDPKGNGDGDTRPGDGRGDGNGNGGPNGSGAGKHDGSQGPARGSKGDGRGSGRNSKRGSDGSGSVPGGSPFGKPASPGGPQPTGSYSTNSLMSAALRLRSLGWSNEQIARKVFAPFIIAGESGFINTWGAPRSGGRSHEGQDVFCDYGAPVLASEAGTIEFDEGGLGGRVARLHRPDGSYWYYAHLADWNTADFSNGDTVRPGDVIGFCGNTGNAITTPPHVHFGWYLANGRAANPMAMLVEWLRAAEKRTLGYVTSAEFEHAAKVEELTSARRFGDDFTFNPAASQGDFPTPLLFTGPLRLALALQESLAAQEGALIVTKGQDDVGDPEVLHFEAWLSSGAGPVAPAGAPLTFGGDAAD